MGKLLQFSKIAHLDGILKEDMHSQMLNKIDKALIFLTFPFP